MGLENFSFQVASMGQTADECSKSPRKLSAASTEKAIFRYVPDRLLACFHLQTCAQPVESGRSQRPLHHFSVGERCEPLRAQLRQQAVQLYAVPSVVLEPTANRRVSGSYSGRASSLDRDCRELARTRLLSEAVCGFSGLPNPRSIRLIIKEGKMVGVQDLSLRVVWRRYFLAEGRFGSLFERTLEKTTETLPLKTMMGRVSAQPTVR